MPHEVAQEHMGYYDARRAGAARTQVTWAAALSAIGATPTMLVLANTGDGVWTITANLTSPVNVTTYIPPGVTVNIASGMTLTLNGPIIAYNPNWKTGPGTLVRGTTAPAEFSAITTSNLIATSADIAALDAGAIVADTVQGTTTGAFGTLTATTGSFNTLNATTSDIGNANSDNIRVNSPPSGGARVNAVRVTTDDNTSTEAILFHYSVGGNIVPGMTLRRHTSAEVQNWEITNNTFAGASNAYMLGIGHPNSLPFLAIGDAASGGSGGVWIGNGSVAPTPSHLLHLQLDDAAKPGGGSWASTSDARLKTVLRPYTDGLAMLLALPAPIVFTFNGKAYTQADGTEYVGMLGQDVQPVAPYMIKTYPEKLDPTDAEPTDILSMNDSAMTYALINAVRELSERVEVLEAALATTRRQGEPGPAGGASNR